MSSKQISLSGFVSKVQQLSIKVANKGFTSLTVLDNSSEKPLFVLVDKDRYDQLVEKAGVVEDPSSQSERRKDPSQAQQQLLKIKNRFPFFEGISDKDIVAITEGIRFLKMKADEPIFFAGETDQDIFIILKGSVEIYITDDNDNEVVLATLEKGSVFGEMAYITNEPRSAHAAASDNNTLILSFKISENTEGMEKVFNILYENFIQILSQNLKNTNQKLFGK